MTKRELLKRLKGYPDDTEVFYHDRGMDPDAAGQLTYVELTKVNLLNPKTGLIYITLA